MHTIVDESAVDQAEFGQRSRVFAKSHQLWSSEDLPIMVHYLRARVSSPIGAHLCHQSSHAMISFAVSLPSSRGVVWVSVPRYLREIQAHLAKDDVAGPGQGSR